DRVMPYRGAARFCSAMGLIGTLLLVNAPARTDDINLKMCKSLGEKREYTGAMPFCDMAIEDGHLSSQDLGIALTYRALVDFETGGDDEIATLDRAIATYPDFAIAYVGRGYAYLLKDRYDAATADADHAIALSPQQSDGYLLRGEILSEQQDVKPALVALDHA